jgi:hypothetical protein
MPSENTVKAETAATERVGKGGIPALTELLAHMADTIESFPPQARSLSERMADESLIEKGV